MFDLTNEAPANAERLDLSARTSGWPKGNSAMKKRPSKWFGSSSSPSEAGDYDAAGQLIPVGTPRL